MTKNFPTNFAVFLLFSVLITGCQKKDTTHGEEEINEAVIVELSEGLPPFECAGSAPELITTVYTNEIANGACLPQIQNFDLPIGSGNAFGIIIKNQASFQKLIKCNSFPGSIDFNKYFVLAGFYYKSKTFLDSLTLFTCDNNLVFKMDMSDGVGGDVGFVFSMAVVDRKYLGKEIVFDMQLK